MTEPAPCIAVLGTGSDVGKSLVAAALCRIFSDLGIRVAPFKAQNMSNNSFVTPDGGEMGRAQVVQAQCARLEPHVDMNPLLLKPSGNGRSQIVLHGRAAGDATSDEFRTDRTALFEKTRESLNRLRAEFELVVIEGAGSCAEVNLREFDIANFRTAVSCGAPVLLVADISRGGVFAQVLGTLSLLAPAERALVKGIIINRFRGDLSLFRDGVEFLEKESGIPVLGVVPHFDHIEIDSEDGVVLDKAVDPEKAVMEGKINIAVVRFPHISNFTDFQPLARDPRVNLSYLLRPRTLDGIDLLILPGTKNTRSDLAWMAENGWDMYIHGYLGEGGRVAGICGGYQMLGKSVEDPHGVEGDKGFAFGLGLLEVRTVFDSEKRLARVTAKTLDGGHPLAGYEIHMGVSKIVGEASPFAVVIAENGAEHPDGAVSPDGKVWGTYLHGLFDEPEFRNALLETLGGGQRLDASFSADGAAHEHRERQYDLLAEFFGHHLDVKKLLEIAGLNKDLFKMKL